MNQPSVFYGSDPFARFLLDKLHLTVMKIAIILPLIVLCITGISFVINHFIPELIQFSFYKYLSFWVWTFFFAPVVVAYYLWIVNAIGSLLQSIKMSHVVDLSDSDRDCLIPKYHQSLWKFLSLACGIIFGVLFFISRSDVPDWNYSFFPRVISTVFMAIGGYIVVMTVIHFILNVISIRKVFQDKTFNLNPLHPDKCGGMKFLSDYSLKTAYLAGAFGVIIGITEYRFITFHLIDKYWYLHLAIPIYILIATICFLLPLSAAHTGMKRAKEELLQDIATQFQNDYWNMQSDLKQTASELKEEVEKIQQLQILYDTTDKFPVWPFDIGTFRRFATTLAAPFIPIIIGLVSNLIQSQIIQKVLSH